VCCSIKIVGPENLKDNIQQVKEGIFCYIMHSVKFEEKKRENRKALWIGALAIVKSRNTQKLSS